MSESTARRILGFHPPDPPGRRTGGRGAGPALRGRDPAGGARPGSGCATPRCGASSIRLTYASRCSPASSPGRPSAISTWRSRRSSSGCWSAWRATRWPSRRVTISVSGATCGGSGTSTSRPGRSPPERPRAGWRRDASCSRSSASGSPRRSGIADLRAKGYDWAAVAAEIGGTAEGRASNSPGLSFASRKSSASTLRGLTVRTPAPPRSGVDREDPAMNQADR